MKFLKLIPLIFLYFTFNVKAEVVRDDNCNTIGDMAFILMTQRQSGLSKEEVIKDLPFDKLTKNEKKIIDNLIGTIYKTPVKGELNTYESLEKFSEIERERCKKLIQEKI
ncbi:hypothetical protein [Acinetobacter pittii]|uniref:hypothetical protein n=1 Tax=Acinetobacter pittii TaxID=48296 RepID=UPI001ABFAC51|nr:hypothetical protein [Acinetobacter pittii]QDB84205.1 hypothetical protein APMS7_18470 [Acinetobacter pittii]